MCPVSMCVTECESVQDRYVSLSVKVSCMDMCH